MPCNPRGSGSKPSLLLLHTHITLLRCPRCKLQLQCYRMSSVSGRSNDADVPKRATYSRGVKQASPLPSKGSTLLLSLLRTRCITAFTVQNCTSVSHFCSLRCDLFCHSALPRQLLSVMLTLCFHFLVPLCSRLLLPSSRPLNTFSFLSRCGCSRPAFGGR